MLSTDRALFTCRCPVLSRGNNWPEKFVVVTQNAILFFDKFQSFYDSEGLKMPTVDLMAFHIVLTEGQERETKNLHQDEKNIIKLVDVSQKKAKLIAFPTKGSLTGFQTAVAISSYYSFYEALCSELRTEPHPYILKYATDLMQNPKAPFHFKETFLEDDFFTPVYELLKKSKLTAHIVFQDQLIVEKPAKVILQLITNFPRNQITHLVFRNTALGDETFDQLLYGFSHHAYLEYLEISSNLLTDRSLPLFTSIFEYMPSLKHLNISGNEIKGLDDFGNFLETILQDLQLKVLDISSNKLKDLTIDLIIAYIFKQPELSIKELNISRNDYSNLGKHKLIDFYYRSPNKDKLKLILKPLPFHVSVLEKLIEGEQTVDITLERISLNNLAKRPPSRPSEFQNIHEILAKINEVKGPTVLEEISRICNKIYQLEYEFPPQKLELLYYVLRKKIQQSIEQQNYYATETLLRAAQQVGLGTQEFEEDVKHIRYKVAKIVGELLYVLNFEVSEEELNFLLDKRLKEALNFGLRGYLIDTMLAIKEKRDELIKNYHKEGYYEEIEEDEENPFIVLERDPDYVGIKGGFEVDLLRLDKCLLLHPAQANYIELSKLSISRLQDTLKTTIAKLKDGENYYIRNAYNRCYFLLLTSLENARSFTKKDKKLYNCRLIIQYRNFVHKKIDRQVPLPVITYPIDMITIPENFKDIIEQFKMIRFPYLRTLGDYVKHAMKRSSEQHSTIASNPEKPEKSEKKELAATLIRMVDFRNLVIPQKRENSSTTPPKDRDKDKDKDKESAEAKESKTPPEVTNSKIPINILEYGVEPLPCSLIKFTNPEMSDTALFLNSFILAIRVLDKSNEELTNIIQTLLRMVHELDPAKCYELNDELYLQFYKITNNAFTTQNAFHHQNAFAGLAVISAFIFPEPELAEYVKAWMYSLINEREIGPYARTILINVINSSLPKFNKPYWVPSKLEINNLLRFENKLSLEIKFQSGNLASKTFMVPHESTVQYIMDQVYSQPQMEQLTDKYSFWLYKSLDSIKLSEDIALPREAVLADLMSKWGDGQSYSLIVKRRVFCSAHTLNIKTLDTPYLESLYEDTFHKFSHCFAFAEYLKIDSVVKIAAVLYLIRQRRKGRDKIEIHEDKITKALTDLIPRSYMIKKTEQEWVERIIGTLNYHLKWLELDLKSLYREFLHVFAACPIFAGSYFSYKKKDNIADRSLPIDGIFCVNIFGMFFFHHHQRDKPSYSLYFEEISYVVGNGNTCKLAYMDKKFGTEVSATLETPRARELVEDIMSYSYLRNLEKNHVFYSFPIIRDFEKVYINRRAAKTETQHELPEDTYYRVEEEIESNELVSLKEPALAFHEKLPLLDEERPIKIQNRKVTREIIADETFRASSIENFGDSRQNSLSDSRRSSAHPGHPHAPTVSKEERKSVFSNLFGFIEESVPRLPIPSKKWASTITGIFRQKNKHGSHSSDAKGSDISGKPSPDSMHLKVPQLGRTLSNEAASSLDLDDDGSSKSFEGNDKKANQESKDTHNKNPLVKRKKSAELLTEKRKASYDFQMVIEDNADDIPKFMRMASTGDPASENSNEVVSSIQVVYEDKKSQKAKRSLEFQGPKIDVVREEEQENSDSDTSSFSQRTPSTLKKVVKKKNMYDNEEDGGVREMIRARKRGKAVHMSKSPFKGEDDEMEDEQQSFGPSSVLRGRAKATRLDQRDFEDDGSKSAEEAAYVRKKNLAHFGALKSTDKLTFGLRKDNEKLGEKAQSKGEMSPSNEQFKEGFKLPHFNITNKPTGAVQLRKKQESDSDSSNDSDDSEDQAKAAEERKRTAMRIMMSQQKKPVEKFEEMKKPEAPRILKAPEKPKIIEDKSEDDEEDRREERRKAKLMTNMQKTLIGRAATLGTETKDTGNKDNSNEGRKTSLTNFNDRRITFEKPGMPEFRESKILDEENNTERKKEDKIMIASEPRSTGTGVKDAAVASRLAKRKASSDDDDEEEDEKMDAQQRSSTKLPTFGVQTQSITKQDQNLACGTMNEKQDQERENAVEISKKDSPSKGLGLALASALKSMPKINNTFSRDLSDEQKAILITKEESEKRDISNVAGQTKDEVKKDNEDQGKTETKQKLGKALFGALSSMPKVKKIE